MVENTRWLAPEPWFERGRPAVYQLPKVLKILKSDQSTKITLSIYLSSSLSWVSPLVTINSFGKPFWKYSKSPKIFQFSDQKSFKTLQKSSKTPKTVKSDWKSVEIVHFHSKTVIFQNQWSYFSSGEALVRRVGCKGVTVSCANRDNIENGLVLKQIQKKVLRHKVHFKLSCKPIWRLSEFLMVNFLHNTALHL